MAYPMKPQARAPSFKTPIALGLFADNFAGTLQNATQNNTAFAGVTLNPTMPVYVAHVQQLNVLIKKAAKKETGAALARNAMIITVREDIGHLLDCVQTVVEKMNDVSAIAALLASLGLPIPKSVQRSKADLYVKAGDVSGRVVLVARSAGENACYYWQFSLDSQNWSSVPDTLVATTVIDGLKRGQTYYFRFRTLTRKQGHGDFSQPISLLVL